MISSLWSNSNYDDDKGTRQQAIESLEEHFEEATRIVRFGKSEEEEIDEENPFFAPVMKGVEKINPQDPTGTVQQAAQSDYARYIDQ
jgi:hypothetical protein